MKSTEPSPSSSSRGATWQGWILRIERLGGWRRQGLSIACGLCSAAALPPLYLVPLLIPAFCGLLLLLSGCARPRQAALIGWSFGFGHFIAGLYWVGIAFLVDASRHAVLMPFAVAGLAAGLALFPALALYLVARCRLAGLARVLLLAAAWLSVEWLRAWVLTGFPWNLLGTVWSFSPAMMQLAALTGVWGLSVLAVLAASAPVLWLEAGDRKGRRQAIALLLLPLLAWGGGAWRLALAPAVGSDTVEGVRLRIVQPVIDQALKWRPELRRQHLVRQMELSVAKQGPSPTHVIWAETAVPFLLNQGSALPRSLSQVVPPGGLLLTGAPRGEAEGGDLWNSLVAVDALGRLAGSYDKHHLVPFGEYVPLREFLPATKMTAGTRDFKPGLGRRTLDLAGLPPFSPLICYEVIFPGSVVAESSERPRWLLNITNDAWFGASSGPYQHFAAARLRAVEEGLPLVRAANTGISGVIDGYGRVVSSLTLNRVGVIDAPLPRANDGLTPYARVGNWAVLALIALLTAAAFLSAAGRRR